MMEAERLKEFAARRAGILSMSSAWGHDDDAALLNQLLARITDLEAQLAARPMNGDGEDDGQANTGARV